MRPVIIVELWEGVYADLGRIVLLERASKGRNGNTALYVIRVHLECHGATKPVLVETQTAVDMYTITDQLKTLTAAMRRAALGQ